MLIFKRYSPLERYYICYLYQDNSNAFLNLSICRTEIRNINLFVLKFIVPTAVEAYDRCDSAKVALICAFLGYDSQKGPHDQHLRIYRFMQPIY